MFSSESWCVIINFYSPINYLGYGIHSYNFLKALDKVKVDIALYPPNNTTEFRDELVEKWIANQLKFGKDDIGVMIYHEQFMNRFYGRKRIGFPVFELSVTDYDIEKLKTLDYILQTSDYFKSYLNSIGFNNVHIIPEGFDEIYYNIYNYNNQNKEQLLNERGIIFSHVGKFEERKCSLDILKTFTYALQEVTIKCTLLINMFNPFFPDWLILIKNFLTSLGYCKFSEEEAVVVFIKNHLKVIVLKCKIKDVREIYDSSHFGIYASKAEGWNLPLIESIASGLPCITSDWTGQSEYLKEYPKELIINKGRELIANDGIWFHGDRGKWIEPDWSSLKQILISIASNPMVYLNLRDKCYSSIKDFTWANSAKKFINFLKTIGEYNE